MPFAPLISKIRCHSPNKKRSTIANKNYLLYIATREGVDISSINDINDFLKQKEDNLSKMNLQEDLLHLTSENDLYLKYISERPRSHGLFGNIDTSDLSKVASQVSEISKQNRCIYRGIISLSQKDAESLGYTNKEQWYQYMKSVMPDIANELGINPIHFTWVGAFHSEKSHPHVHYEIWDNSDKVKSPFIHKSVQIKCRELLSSKIFDEQYERTIKEIYRDEREELNSIRNQSRKSITNITNDEMNEIGELFAPGLINNKLPDKTSNKDLEFLCHEMKKLIIMLPEKGSIDYAYLPVTIKTQVDIIAKKLLDRMDIKKEVSTYLEAVSDGNKLLGKTKFEINIEQKKAEIDLKNRVNNIICKKSKEIKIGLSSLDIKSEMPYELATQSKIEHETRIEAVNSKKKCNTQDNTNNKNEAPHANSKKLVTVSVNGEKYCMDWSDQYKEALDYIYNKENRNLDKAYKILLEESKHNVLALHDLGKLHEKFYEELGLDIDENSKYYEKSLTIFLALEKEKKNPYIEYRIGKLYDQGKGIEQNYEIAAGWYTQSSDKESPNKYAQYQLGKIYSDTNTPFLNIKKSIEFYTKSSNQGNTNAQYQLGKIYLNSEYDTYNIHKSIEFFTEAASKGDQFAQYQLGKIYLWGIKNIISSNEELGRYWLNQSISQGNEYAAKTLEMYDNMPGLSYSLIKSTFNCILNTRDEKIENTKHFRSKSKQAIKEEILKTKGH